MGFIRLQGCNLIPKCHWCDTLEAQDGNQGVEMSVEEVVKSVRSLSSWYNSWICITGGEPLFQEDSLHQLVVELKKYGHRITIETNGSYPPPRWYTLADSWNADIKCPSSGVCGVSKEIWFQTRFCDQIKFVVGNREDLEFAKSVVDRHKASSPIVLVSPIVGKRPPGGMSEWYEVEEMGWMQGVVEFCKRERVRFSLQWHKLVGIE